MLAVSLSPRKDRYQRFCGPSLRKRGKLGHLSCYHVNVLVHMNVNVPGTKTSRCSGTCTFTSTSTFTC